MSVYATKPLDWFLPDPDQPRQQFDEDELVELGESMKVRQHQPVVALSNGKLLIGARRLWAARLVGLTHLNVIIIDEALTPLQIRVSRFQENHIRTDLTDFEKWKALEELLTLDPGMTNRDLAALVHMPEPTVTKYLSTSKCVPEVQAALEAGALRINDVYTISRAAPEQQLELLRLKLAGESRDDLAIRIKRQKATHFEAVRVKRFTCPLPSGVNLVVTANDLCLDALLECLATAQKEARKAREQGLDIRTFSRVMTDKARKGGA